MVQHRTEMAKTCICLVVFFLSQVLSENQVCRLLFDPLRVIVRLELCADSEGTDQTAHAYSLIRTYRCPLSDLLSTIENNRESRPYSRNLRNGENFRLLNYSFFFVFFFFVFFFFPSFIKELEMSSSVILSASGKKASSSYADSKSPDQTAHLHSQIRAFAVRFFNLLNAVECNKG